MPRSAGFSTSKYREQKGTGQAVVTIAGRDRYLGPWRTGGILVEYDRLVGEWLAAGWPTSVTTADDLTVTELCRAYKRHAEDYYVRGGRLFNIVSALRTLRIRYGARRLRAVREGTVFETHHVRVMLSDATKVEAKLEK
jgi:hypothetical protein